jgi:hypothetical protein
VERRWKSLEHLALCNGLSKAKASNLPKDRQRCYSIWLERRYSDTKADTFLERPVGPIKLLICNHLQNAPFILPPQPSLAFPSMTQERPGM